MSQSLNFRITANDQASRVVTEVQKKVLDFGKDIGRSITAVVGPMAVVGLAFSKVQQKMADMKQAADDAFKWGAGLTRQAANLGLTVEQLQKLQQVADATGVPLEKVAEAFKESQRVIEAAKRGNAEAIEGLNALGISAQDLADLTPEKVIEAMGKALVTIEDPTKKATAAFALFGEQGKKLVDTLERLRKLTEVPVMPGLTPEEAEFLRDQELAEEGEKNKERLRLARQSAVERFLETDEGKKIVERERSKERRQAPLGAGMPGGGALSASGSLSVSTLAQRKEIQDEALRRLKKGPEAPPTPEETAAGEGLVTLGEERQAKPEKVAKPAKPEEPVRPEAEAVTVSSLRQIGGALAGEVVGGVDYQQLQVDLQREMVRLLSEVSNNLKPGTDPTKGSFDNVNPAAVGPNAKIGFA
jgi:hypothetical protein